jgi:hypothetical protein
MKYTPPVKLINMSIFQQAEVLHGAIVKMPPQFGTFKQARKVQQKEVEQKELGFAQCPLLLCLAQQ